MNANSKGDHADSRDNNNSSKIQHAGPNLHISITSDQASSAPVNAVSTTTSNSTLKSSTTKPVTNYLKSELIDTKIESSSRPVTFHTMDTIPHLNYQQESTPSISSSRRQSDAHGSHPQLGLQISQQQQQQIQQYQQSQHQQQQGQQQYSISPHSPQQQYSSSHTSQTQPLHSLHSQSSQLLNYAQLNTNASILHHSNLASENTDNQSLYPNSVITNSIDVTKKPHKEPAKDEEEFIYNDTVSTHTLGNTGDFYVGPSDYSKAPRKNSVNRSSEYNYTPSYLSYLNAKNHADDEYEGQDGQSLRSYGRFNNVSYPSLLDSRGHKNSELLYPNQYSVPGAKTPLLGVPKNYQKKSKLSSNSGQYNESDPKRAIISHVRKVSQRLFSGATARATSSSNNEMLPASNSHIPNGKYIKNISNMNSEYYNDGKNLGLGFERPSPARSFVLKTIRDYDGEDSDNWDLENDTTADMGMQDPDMYMTKSYYNNSPSKKYYPESLRSYGSVLNSSATYRASSSANNIDRSDSEDLNYRTGKSPFYANNNYDEYSPHDFKPIYYKQNLFFKIVSSIIYSLVILFLGLITLRIFFLKNYENQLSDFKIDAVDRIIMSSELLIFELDTSAHNYNFQDVTIWNMNLDVFLLTNVIKSEPPGSAELTTILLGNSQSFTIPLEFKGILSTGFSLSIIDSAKLIWDRLNHRSSLELNYSIGQVKIPNPGKSARSKFNNNSPEYNANEGGISEDQWHLIINSPFTLIIRGSLDYKLPLVSHDEIISVSVEKEVIPI